jgi:hypothetical protein
LFCFYGLLLAKATPTIAIAIIIATTPEVMYNTRSVVVARPCADDVTVGVAADAALAWNSVSACDE